MPRDTGRCTRLQMQQFGASGLLESCGAVNVNSEWLSTGMRLQVSDVDFACMCGHAIHAAESYVSLSEWGLDTRPFNF